MKICHIGPIRWPNFVQNSVKQPAVAIFNHYLLAISSSIAPDLAALPLPDATNFISAAVPLQPMVFVQIDEAEQYKCNKHTVTAEAIAA